MKETYRTVDCLNHGWFWIQLSYSKCCALSAFFFNSFSNQTSLICVLESGGVFPRLFQAPAAGRPGDTSESPLKENHSTFHLCFFTTEIFRISGFSDINLAVTTFSPSPATDRPSIINMIILGTYKRRGAGRKHVFNRLYNFTMSGSCIIYV